MNKFLFVLANYRDRRQYLFENYFSNKNKLFCDIHGYEYIEITDSLEPYRGNYTWLKFTKIKELMDLGILKDGDKIVNLDADMSIQKFDLDYPNSKSFSYCIDSGNSHCMGNFSMIINDWTRNLIDLILSEDRYIKLKDVVSRHDLFNSYSSFWNDFREQASWYSLAGIKRHSQNSFWDLPDFGWHSEFNSDVVYNLEELHKHVELISTNWNVTLIENENEGENVPWYINKVAKSDIIIRHFAGGVSWSDEYL